MKTWKRAAAVAAAIAMTAAGSLPVYADAVDAVTESKTFGKDGGSASSTLTGTISITNISVMVPITAGFDIDPNKSTAVTSQTEQQILAQASNYTITNQSDVDLDVSITKVVGAAGVGGVVPSITNNVDDLGASGGAGKIMFSIRPKATSIASIPALPASGADTTKAWLNPGADGAIDNTYKFTDAGAVYTLAAKGNVQLWLYGATKNGWNQNNTFTITPTFTVKLHETT